MAIICIYFITGDTVFFPKKTYAYLDNGMDGW